MANILKRMTNKSQAQINFAAVNNLPAPEPVIPETLLELVSDSWVFQIRAGGGNFIIEDLCDNDLLVVLSRAELRELGKEIMALAGGDEETAEVGDDTFC